MPKRETPPHVVEKQPGLVVDHEEGIFNSPRPLDRRIASVYLRTPTNDPTEGYDLALSASFGEERLLLRSADYEISVSVSLISADVELHFSNCTHSLPKSEPAEEWNTKIKQNTKSSSLKKSNRGIEAKGSLGTGGEATAKSGISGGREKNKSVATETSTEREKSQKDWHRIGSDTIKIGRGSSKLDGPMLSDYIGWRIKPQRNNVSAVQARVCVREDWVNFESPELRSAPKKWHAKLRELFLNAEWKSRRELFLALLRHLAQSQLARFQNGEQATIAVSTLVLRPNEDEVSIIPSEKSSVLIEIPQAPIEHFLETASGHEVAALLALGVPRNCIPDGAIGSHHGENRHEIGGVIFTPQSSPYECLDLLRRISLSSPRAEAIVDRDKPTLADLGNLGLIQSGHKFAPAYDVGTITAVDALCTAAKKQSSISITRDVIRINSRVTGREIAEAVSAQLGFGYLSGRDADHTGLMLNAWAVWVDAHGKDGATSSKSGHNIRTAISTSIANRAPRLAKHSRETLVEMIVEQQPLSRIAHVFGVPVEKVQEWIGPWSKGLRDPE